jgi:hypothetical protein
MSGKIANPPVVPAIGTSGSFTLSSPFSVPADTVYVVSAVRTFADLAMAGQDPMALIYAPAGLTQTDYDNDVASGAVVVVLTSGTSAPVYVPSSYLSQQPSKDVVPYSMMVGSFNLGPLPDSLDLTALTNLISQLISATMGIASPEVLLHAIPATTVVTSAQDAAMTQARLASVTNNKTLYARLVTLQTSYNSLQQRYNALASACVNAGLTTESASASGSG